MDRAVQKTDVDAAQSKLSAVQKGYYEDEYIQLFGKQAMPRLPLINIGTYCRVKALDQLIYKFLEAKGKKQIISLGAGSDTRPFHLLAKDPNLTIYELDFPIKTRAKAEQIIASPELFTLVGQPVRTTESQLDSMQYHLIGQDLRELDTLDAPKDVPTLVLSECCLCYISPEDNSKILGHFVRDFPDISLALYEPIGLGDEFGRVMMENLAQRGLCLPTFEKYSTVEAQKQRLLDLNLTASDACDVLTVYERWLSVEDRVRISSLEFLDEVEEMNLLLRHYSIVWGSSKGRLS